MTPIDREHLIQQIMALLWKFKDLPPRLIAERMVIDVLEKKLQNQQDLYERLMLMDSSNPN